MKYSVLFSCTSHIGKRRSSNQDNFICNGKYMDPKGEPITFPISGTISDAPALFGVFDGMGGEECGEVASLIASRCASEASVSEKPLEALLDYCGDANGKICAYAEENDITAMGTTAALLAFTKNEIALCNIGDSKIFRLADNELKQISVDHYAVAVFGQKPPLSQNLGIPPSEMIIEPYLARGRYNDGDVYLLCSDGLTDMVPVEDITRIILKGEFDEIIENLLNAALENGGKDNITIILCKVQRRKRNIFSRLFRADTREEGEWKDEH